jgi:gamma-glutamylcyclotransferase (GGCT)/AIG2-like uncharacterized protein YtfP
MTMKGNSFMSNKRLMRLIESPGSLFVYGSLMFPEVLETLLDRIPPLVPAKAFGWQTIKLSEVVYPGLINNPGTQANGYLLTDLSDLEWQLLEAFENPIYNLVRLETDQKSAWVFALEEFSGNSESWDSDNFKAKNLISYVNRCAVWRQKYDAQSEYIGRKS